MSAGKAYLVGAGSGHPDLITVKGLKLVQSADLILYDRLIPRELLDEVRPDAQLIFVGKRAGHHPKPQDEINRILLEQVALGKQVVRLKGGDPFVFGRGGEEAIALAAAGLAFEIVPGISSSIAAPAYAGIPLTQKGVATGFALVTGHETPDKPNSTTDWAAMAHVPTLVVLMGLTKLPDVVAALLENGKDPNTPTALLGRATTNEQKVIIGTLSTVSALAKKEKILTPAITIVGEVVQFAERFAWFSADTTTEGFAEDPRLPSTHPS